MVFIMWRNQIVLFLWKIYRDYAHNRKKKQEKLQSNSTMRWSERTNGKWIEPKPFWEKEQSGLCRCVRHGVSDCRFVIAIHYSAFVGVCVCIYCIFDYYFCKCEVSLSASYCMRYITRVQKVIPIRLVVSHDC